MTDTAVPRHPESLVEEAIVALAAARLWLVGDYATRDRDEFNAEGWTHLVDRVGLALSGKPGWMHSARTYRLRGEQLAAHRLAVPSQPDHEHYWVDAFDDETAWHCTICGVTEYPDDPALDRWLRHGATCNLQAVRDNPPDDEDCSCGLREAFITARRTKP